MDLGSFSISLTVADLTRSLSFYEALGFTKLDGDADQGWLVLTNGAAKIGLFQGMFEHNLITFNPPDARAVESALNEAGHAPDKAIEGDEGPCHFVVKDPDGNVLLIDQH